MVHNSLLACSMTVVQNGWRLSWMLRAPAPPLHPPIQLQTTWSCRARNRMPGQMKLLWYLSACSSTQGKGRGWAKAGVAAQGGVGAAGQPCGAEVNKGLHRSLLRRNSPIYCLQILFALSLRFQAASFSEHFVCCNVWLGSA